MEIEGKIQGSYQEGRITSDKDVENKGTGMNLDDSQISSFFFF